MEDRQQDYGAYMLDGRVVRLEAAVAVLKAALVQLSSQLHRLQDKERAND